MNEMNTEETSTLIKMTKFEKTLTTILTCILIAYGMSFRYQGQIDGIIHATPTALLFMYYFYMMLFVIELIVILGLSKSKFSLVSLIIFSAFNTMSVFLMLINNIVLIQDHPIFSDSIYDGLSVKYLPLSAIMLCFITSILFFVYAKVEKLRKSKIMLVIIYVLYLISISTIVFLPIKYNLTIFIPI